MGIRKIEPQFGLQLCNSQATKKNLPRNRTFWWYFRKKWVWLTNKF